MVHANSGSISLTAVRGHPGPLLVCHQMLLTSSFSTVMQCKFSHIFNVDVPINLQRIWIRFPFKVLINLIINDLKITCFDAQYSLRSGRNLACILFCCIIDNFQITSRFSPDNYLMAFL